MNSFCFVKWLFFVLKKNYILFIILIKNKFILIRNFTFFIIINRIKIGFFYKVIYKILKKYIFFYFDVMVDIVRVY